MSQANVQLLSYEKDPLEFLTECGQKSIIN